MICTGVVPLRDQTQRDMFQLINGVYLMKRSHFIIKSFALTMGFASLSYGHYDGANPGPNHRDEIVDPAQALRQAHDDRAIEPLILEWEGTRVTHTYVHTQNPVQDMFYPHYAIEVPEHKSVFTFVGHEVTLEIVRQMHDGRPLNRIATQVIEYLPWGQPAIELYVQIFPEAVGEEWEHMNMITRYPLA